MEKIRATIKLGSTLSGTLAGKGNISGQIGTNYSQYYYTKAEIDAFRETDKEYVDSQDLILEQHIEASGHKLSSSLVNNILTISLLDANNNIISYTSESVATDDKYIIRGEYDVNTESIIFYYNDNTSFSVSVAGLIDSLPTKEEVAELDERVTALEEAGLISKDISVVSTYLEYTLADDKNEISTNRSWTAYDSPTDLPLQASCYGELGYLFISKGYNPTGINCKYTKNGLGWYNIEHFRTYTLYDCAYYDNKFYVIYQNGDNLVLSHCDNPTSYLIDTWEDMNVLESNATFVRLKQVNNVLFLLTDNEVRYSYDGVKFNKINFNSNETNSSIKQDLIIANGRYVFSTDKGILYQENINDFANWEFSYPFGEDNQISISAMIFFNNKLIVSQIYSLLIPTTKYTIDITTFSTWNNCSIPGSIIGSTGYSYGENRLYSVQGNNILYSNDGITYNIEYISFTNLYTIIYGNEKFIATGVDGYNSYLDLDVTWSPIKPSPIPDDKFLWIRNCIIQSTGEIVKTDGYLNYIPGSISVFENDAGYVTKDVNDLENYYNIPTADDLYDEKQDVMDNIDNEQIDDLFN